MRESWPESRKNKKTDFWYAACNFSRRDGYFQTCGPPPVVGRRQTRVELDGTHVSSEAVVPHT
jgi:hypothetical protein